MDLKPVPGIRQSPPVELMPSRAKESVNGANKLTDEEKREVERMKRREREVRAHEMAHKTAAGELAQGAIRYEYEMGPDGKRYVTGGSVNLDVAPVPGEPEKTIKKAQKIQRAALAPAKPSTQDRQVAAQAAAMERQARMEKNQSQDSQAASKLSRYTNAAAGKSSFVDQKM